MIKKLEKLERENAELKEQNAHLQWENRQLNEKLRYFLRQLFSKKSEQLDPRQLELPLDLSASNTADQPETPPPEEPTSKSRKKRKSRKERLPENLPVEEVVIEPDEVKENPEAYRCIGQEATDELNVLASRFYIVRTIRPKYVKIEDRSAAPVVAPAPVRLIENSYASVSLLVYIILGKYVDHLPLYRQEQIFKRRYGVEISRKTMCDWMWKIADWLRLIYDEMKEEIRASGYIQADETPIRYLNPGHGKTSKGYLWTYHSPGFGVVFEWHPSRSASCMEDMLHTFKGDLQCDGYQAYPSYAQDKCELELYGCWAHARRKFFDAKDDSYFSVWILRQIQLLYRIEKHLRDTAAGPALCEAVRQSQSRMIIKRIEKALKQKIFKYRPKSLTGKAIAYALNRWNELEKYISSGVVQIDNNLVENAIRPTAIGKKNWLFFGSKNAGWQSAVLYSILETCRKLEINQHEYLTEIMTLLPHITNQQVRQLTPLKWANAKLQKSA